MAQAPGGEVLVYEAPGGGVRVEVRLDRDTVWLTQRQMSELFETTPENVLMHLKKIYADGELEEPATAKDFLAVRMEGKRRVQRQLKHYNLDAIISVGYRVNSRRGVRFRQWATSTLREHLVRGYTINQQRFEHNARELEAAMALVRKAAAGEALSTDQGRGLVDVIARYTQTFLLLQRYDEGLLVEPKGIAGGVLPPVGDARGAITRLKHDLLARGEATDRSDASARKGWLPCSATWTRACSASRRTRPSNRRLRTCCTSSSRTTLSPTATSESARSYSSSSCIATGG
jgi:hypothetical protein